MLKLRYVCTCASSLLSLIGLGTMGWVMYTGPSLTNPSTTDKILMIGFGESAQALAAKVCAQSSFSGDGLDLRTLPITQRIPPWEQRLGYAIRFGDDQLTAEEKFTKPGFIFVARRGEAGFIFDDIEMHQSMVYLTQAHLNDGGFIRWIRSRHDQELARQSIQQLKDEFAVERDSYTFPTWARLTKEEAKTLQAGVAAARLATKIRQRIYMVAQNFVLYDQASRGIDRNSAEFVEKLNPITQGLTICYNFLQATEKDWLQAYALWFPTDYEARFRELQHARLVRIKRASVACLIGALWSLLLMSSPCNPFEAWAMVSTSRLSRRDRLRFVIHRPLRFCLPLFLTRTAHARLAEDLEEERRRLNRERSLGGRTRRPPPPSPIATPPAPPPPTPSDAIWSATPPPIVATPAPPRPQPPPVEPPVLPTKEQLQQAFPKTADLIPRLTNTQAGTLLELLTILRSLNPPLHNRLIEFLEQCRVIRDQLKPESKLVQTIRATPPDPVQIKAVTTLTKKL